MAKHVGDENSEPKGHTSDMPGAPAPREGLSLKGDEGREVALNVARLALGQITIRELNDPRYSLTREGTVSLHLDAESTAALEEVGR